MDNTEGSQETDIMHKYVSYFLEHGEQPESVYKFAKEAKISEADFYDHFGSFEGLHEALWTNWLAQTLETLQADDNYAQLSVREKLLSFYFTLCEVLKQNRSFILASADALKNGVSEPTYLETFKKEFQEYAKTLVNDGIDSKEIVMRRYVSDRYYQAFWVQCLFVIRFWVKDKSKGLEKTDAAIEKAVNVSFELIGRGPVETILDFGKFILQNR